MKALLPIIIIALIALTNCNNETQNEWVKWRGPNVNSVVSEAGWSAEKLDSSNVLWIKDVGYGHSAVAVWRNQCFISGWKETITALDTVNASTIYCIDTKTGDDIWTFTYSSDKRSFGGPRSSPVIDKNRMYSLSWAGMLFCLDVKTGEEIWQVDLAKDSLTILDEWGYNPSPVIYDDLLLLNLNKGGIALNKKTGEVVWNSEVGSSSYASVYLLDFNDKECGVFQSDSILSIIDIRNGNVVTDFKRNSDQSNNNDVVLQADGNLFASCELFDLNEGEIKQLWRNDTIASGFRNGVLVGNYAYQFSKESRKMELYCVDVNTGKPVWTEDLGRWGALTAVNDKLIILTGLGNVIIADAAPEKYNPIKELQVLSAEDEKENWCWVAPTFFDGKLYVRNSRGEMACVDLSLQN